MMLLNERAMQAMLDDANEIDYDLPDDKAEGELVSFPKKDETKKKDNIIHGRDFSLGVPLPRNLDLRTSSNTISPKLRKLARQLENVDLSV